MFMSRREWLAGGALGGAWGGGAGVTAEQIDERELSRALAPLVEESRAARRSALAGDVQYVGAVREQMLQFLRSTNKWPDFMDVGHLVWMTIYDWHVRFNMQPQVVRTPDGRYGLTFMFTTLVLRPDQNGAHVGMGYDRVTG